MLSESYSVLSQPLLLLLPPHGVFLLEDRSRGIKLLRSLLAAGTLSTLASLYTKGELPGLRDLLTRRDPPLHRLDLKDWIDMEKSLPFAGEESELAYLPLLSKKVSVTAYTPTPEETDSDPEVASCGKYDHILRSGMSVIALSRDLFFHPKMKELLGKDKPLCGLPAVVQLPDGRQIQGIVMDTMNPRFTKKVDIMVPLEPGPDGKARAKAKALDFGILHGARLTVFLPLEARAVREALASVSFLEKVSRWMQESRADT